jgi:hypothetical protein
MNKILSWTLAAALMLGLPSFAMAKGAKGPVVKGKVTAVSETSITVTEGKKQGGESKTVNVPTGTPITTKDGTPAPALADLVGKHVKIKESTEGTAKAIVVTAAKGGKKKTT